MKNWKLLLILLTINLNCGYKEYNLKDFKYNIELLEIFNAIYTKDTLYFRDTESNVIKLTFDKIDTTENNREYIFMSNMPLKSLRTKINTNIDSTDIFFLQIERSPKRNYTNLIFSFPGFLATYSDDSLSYSICKKEEKNIQYNNEKIYYNYRLTSKRDNENDIVYVNSVKGIVAFTNFGNFYYRCK